MVAQGHWFSAYMLSISARTGPFSGEAGESICEDTDPSSLAWKDGSLAALLGGPAVGRRGLSSKAAGS